MTFDQGKIPGETERGRAERAAHLLARLGVQAVDLGGRRVHARETDLPGLLTGGGERVLTAACGRELSIIVGPASADWRTHDPELAASLRRITKELE